MKLFVNGHEVDCGNEQNLLAALRQAGFFVMADCGGKGTCGKCRVQVENPPAPKPAEVMLLRGEELDAGVRLACFTEVFDGLRVRLEDAREVRAVANAQGVYTDGAPYVCVADIGTTTVAVGLADASSGEVFAVLTQNNAQSPYGADVLARIAHASDDGGAQSRLIASQLGQMLGALLKDYPEGFLRQVYVCGNTAMMHILFGVPAASLGVAPYEAVFLESRTASAGELGIGAANMDISDVSVTCLPMVASFVGADVTAGIAALWTDAPCYRMLVDLGTNAEIVLYNNERFFASSAAAGPAFEGANIRCGCAAVPGAVCRVWEEDGLLRFETVDGAPPVGICGSGLIDLVAVLRRRGTIDETGMLALEKVELAEGVALYAEDVRELQLAKSAVCSVIELLLLEAGIGEDEVEQLFLAGGFGKYLNAGNASDIGLFPRSLAAKACAPGNTALLGTALYACDERLRECSLRFAREARVLDLAADSGFYERFMENMLFDA